MKKIAKASPAKKPVAKAQAGKSVKKGFNPNTSVKDPKGGSYYYEEGRAGGGQGGMKMRKDKPIYKGTIYENPKNPNETERQRGDRLRIEGIDKRRKSITEMYEDKKTGAKPKAKQGAVVKKKAVVRKPKK